MEINEIYLDDCLELIPSIPDHSIDMILCDLPYGITACHWDTIIPLEPLWEQYKRIIKLKGTIVLTANQPFTTMLINAAGLDWFKYEWIWEKSRGTGFMHVKNAPLKIHENIIVFSSGVINHHNMTKNRMIYYPQIRTGTPYKRIRKTSNVERGTMHKPTKANIDYIGTINKNPGVRYPNSVLHFPTHNYKKHPTQKPVALFSYLIRTYTNPGDLVLDNAAGSGTTAIAAIRTGRNWLLIEKDEEYYRIAKERIEDELKQPLLPGIEEKPVSKQLGFDF